MKEYGQTKKNSTIEITVNTVTGFFIAMILNIFVLPYFVEGIIAQNIGTAVIVGIIYTSVSYLRGYGFRRLFNKVDTTVKLI